jgi:hypothetical protein
VRLLFARKFLLHGDKIIHVLFSIILEDSKGSSQLQIGMNRLVSSFKDSPCENCKQMGAFRFANATKFLCDRT